MRTFVYVYLCLALFAPTLQAALYKWVDAEGNVHFSDRVPPSDARHERKVLNQKTGHVIETIERSKTVKEIQEQRRLDEIKAKMAKDLKLEKKRDRTLLLTYQSVTEIQFARDAKIKTIENAIQISMGTLKSHKLRLGVLRTSAADYERSSRVIPKKLLNKMAATKESIITTNNHIEYRRREQKLVSKKFTELIKRYKDLTE